MKFFSKYAEEVDIVFRECKAIINKYPDGIRELGLACIDKLDPSKVKEGNYITYMLPFWLKEPFGMDGDVIKKLSMANVFKMLCASIQDKVIDSLNPEKYIKFLPLGNLFFIEFYKIYQEILPGDSVFWGYLERYFHDWAVSIEFEKNSINSGGTDLSDADLSVLAKKAAPIKLSACAVCLLSGNETRISNLDEQINYALITLQLVDDWVDKYKDFEDKCYTPVLGEIMRFASVEKLELLERSHINDAAYFSGIPNKIYEISLKHRKNIAQLMEIHIPDLVNFHEVLIGEIETIVRRTESKKGEILQGGLYNFLNNK